MCDAIGFYSDSLPPREDIQCSSFGKSTGGMELKTMRMTILGGDDRSLYLAKLLHEDGNEVTLFGFDTHSETHGLTQVHNLQEAIQASKVIVAPLPFIDHTGHLNTPYHTKKIKVAHIFQQMNENQLFLGGYLNQTVLKRAEKQQIRTIDYFKREELQVYNAIPTAEGAIQVAMEHMETTIHGASMMILGFGRIAKALAHRLASLGAHVTVVARKHEDIAWITSYGYEARRFAHFKSSLHKMDVIINTAPAMLIDEIALGRIHKDTLLIDVASKPGGIDFTKAKSLGIKAIAALGLPGKVAPLTAASCIRESIYNILADMEGNK